MQLIILKVCLGLDKMKIKKLNLMNKKGAAIAINKTMAIILVIAVIATAAIFLFRTNLPKWLNFLPDYQSEEEQGFEECEVRDNCEVLNSACICTNKAGAQMPCGEGEYCYDGNKGCLTEEYWEYEGQNVCK